MRFALIIFVIVVIAAVVFTGSNDETELRTPESTSVDGATIETGLELDETNLIVAFSDTFKINQDFYIHFENNGPFENEKVTFHLVDTKNDQILAQEQYDVETDDHDLYSLVFFSNPGLYRIVAIVGDQIRATREVIIEE
ncbi:MAG: hypothetical protein FJ152_00365 [Firmicutes bacterium]|nr:hypothetical protein [Bacillota bacterium]